ncbi:MAG: hypothetical protein ABI846_00765 [Rudaea sp.]
MRREYIFTAARWLFALLYLSTGVAIALITLFGIGGPPPQPNADAQAFTDALTRSHFIDPLLALCYLVGGGALLFRLTAPFGLVVLAPVIVVIFFFHVVLSGQWPWGSLNLAWLLFLAWHFRAAFQTIWSHDTPAGRVLPAA